MASHLIVSMRTISGKLTCLDMQPAICSRHKSLPLSSLTLPSFYFVWISLRKFLSALVAKKPPFQRNPAIFELILLNIVRFERQHRFYISPTYHKPLQLQLGCLQTGILLDDSPSRSPSRSNSR